METRELPIGYWIKQADELLTKQINEIQSAFGVTRTHWQILSLLMSHKKHEIQKHILILIMQPFIEQTELETLIKHFVSENIMIANEDKLALTDKGEKIQKQCLEKQKSLRHKCMHGIPGEDYQTTIATLQKIVTNLTEPCSSVSEN